MSESSQNQRFDFFAEETLWQKSAVFAALVHVAAAYTFIHYGQNLMPTHRIEEKVTVTMAEVEKVFKTPEVEPEVLMKPIGEATPVKPNQKVIRTAEHSIRSNPKTIVAPVENDKPLPQNFGLLAVQSAEGSSSTLALSAPQLDAKKTTFKKVGLTGTLKNTKQELTLAPIVKISGHDYHGEIEKEMQVEEVKRIRKGQKQMEIRGGLESSVIQQLVEERLPSMRICYEMAMLKKPDLQGQLLLTWTIQPNGTVSDVLSQSQTIEETLLHPCLRERIVKWTFPAPKGGGIVNVKYPFIFNKTKTGGGSLEVSVTEGPGL